MMIPYEEICKELGVKIGESTVISTAVNGEKYITLTSGGERCQGAPYPVSCLSVEKAWELYESELRKYLKDKRIIYWRCLPEIKEIVCMFGGNRVNEEWGISVTLYSVYSRLTGE